MPSNRHLRVLEMLGPLRPNGSRGGWTAFCPAHDDRRHRSLSVRVMPDGWMAVKCFAGCERREILAAVGLTVADLAPERDGSRLERPSSCRVTAEKLRELETYCEAACRRLGGTSDLASRALDYLARRFGVDRDQALRLGLGADPGAAVIDRPDFLAFGGPPRLVIPFRDPAGMVRGAQARDLTDKARARWVSPRGEGWARWGAFCLDGADFVVVTEGPSDALAVAGAGQAAIFIRGAALGPDASLVEALAGRPAVVVGDNDPAGKSFAQRTLELLRKADVPATGLHAPADFADLAAWRVAAGSEALAAALVASCESARPRRRAELAKPVSVADPTRKMWPVLDAAALYGLAGECVQAIEPHVEADPAQVLVTLLVAFGAAVGPAPHAFAGNVEHPARLSAVIVGRTSKARKGTSWAIVRRLLDVADGGFVCDRIFGGFGSGEAVVDAVRDPAGEDDEGVRDKRLLVLEAEFARVLTVCGRKDSTLSMIVREAWDGGKLQARARQRTSQASGAHVAVLGQITLEELRRLLTETQMANGFANRHLFACARRAQLLPAGGNLDDATVNRLGDKLRLALERARRITRLQRSAEAEARWADLYHEMAEDDPGGLVGSVIDRAEAQTLRLSVVYALLDGSKTIERPHLEAAWAVWCYCRQSAAYIFGDTLGDETADRLLDAYRKAGAEGLDGTQERNLFHHHASGANLDRARRLLEDRGHIVTETRKTGGRDRRVTRAVDHATEATKATEVQPFDGPLVA
jgi:Toprim-like